MVVTLSEKAAREVKRMLAEQQSPTTVLLRVEVVGGGCSGYEYRLQFIGTPEEEDLVDECHGVRVAVDKKSAKYLSGVEIDIGDGLNKRGFIFNNPLATRTCGCGTSFQV